MRRLSAVSVLLIFGMYILSGSALAWVYQSTGNTSDTATGTTLTSTGTNNKMHYIDSNSNPRDPVNGANTFTKLVTTEYGMGVGESEGGVFPSTRGFSNIWPLQFVNNGNAPMTFSVTYEAKPSAEAIGWTHAVYLGTGESAPVASGTSFTLAEDEGVSLEVKITSSTEAAHSPDLSQYRVNLYWHPSQSYPAAGSVVLNYGGLVPLYYYTGVNNLTYGGATAEYSIPDILQIQTPVIKMTRTATTDSPTLYTLGAHDPVPGSLYTMNITVTDEGTANANNVIVIDKVPANMVAYKCNVLAAGETNVNVTAPTFESVGGTGWGFYYTISSEAQVNKSFDGAGWVSLGDAGTSQTIPSTAPVTFVKWQVTALGGKPSDPPLGSWARLQWSCYIK